MKSSPSWFKNHEIIFKIRSNINNFMELAIANADNAKVEFGVDEEYLVTDTERTDIVLYENCLEKHEFIFPSRPGKPIATAITHNSVTLEWTDEQTGSEGSLKYKILYHQKDKLQWSEMLTNDNKKTMCIADLPSSTSFQFKVQSISSVCLSATSNESEVITTAPPITSGR
jgi:hypothetical protein